MPYLPTFDDSDFELEPTENVVREGLSSSSTSDQRLRIAIRALRQMREQVTNVIETLEQGMEEGVASSVFRTEGISSVSEEAGRVVEGVFDGEKMMGTDGMKYLVPPNYSSKSKLVEGDILKLTIKDDGSFIYKQISPVERERVTGVIAMDDTGNYGAQITDGRVYRILTASVTYFKGNIGDEVVALIPKGQKCVWAAVEHILKS